MIRKITLGGVFGCSVGLLAMVAAAQSGDATLTDADDAARLDAQGAAALEAFDDRVVTLQGRFEQTVTGADGRIKESADGYMKLSRPGRFLWVYESPYEQRIVADGENLWLYDVDLDQVSVRAQDEALGRSPAEILSGTDDALAAFDYQGSFREDSMLWTQLSAKDPDSDFRVIRLGFRDGELAGMALGDNLGQVTRILFDDVLFDAPVDDGEFEFTPPPGVDVIGTPAGVGDTLPIPVVPGLG